MDITYFLKSDFPNLSAAPIRIYIYICKSIVSYPYFIYIVLKIRLISINISKVFIFQRRVKFSNAVCSVHTGQLGRARTSSLPSEWHVVHRTDFHPEVGVSALGHPLWNNRRLARRISQ